MGYLTSGDESKDSRVRGHLIIAGLQDAAKNGGARAILPVTLTLLSLSHSSNRLANPVGFTFKMSPESNYLPPYDNHPHSVVF